MLSERNNHLEEKAENHTALIQKACHLAKGQTQKHLEELRGLIRESEEKTPQVLHDILDNIAKIFAASLQDLSYRRSEALISIELLKLEDQELFGRLLCLVVFHMAKHSRDMKLPQHFFRAVQLHDDLAEHYSKLWAAAADGYTRYESTFSLRASEFLSKTASQAPLQLQSVINWMAYNAAHRANDQQPAPLWQETEAHQFSKEIKRNYPACYPAAFYYLAQGLAFKGDTDLSFSLLKQLEEENQLSALDHANKGLMKVFLKHRNLPAAQDLLKKIQYNHPELLESILIALADDDDVNGYETIALNKEILLQALIPINNQLRRELIAERIDSLVSTDAPSINLATENPLADSMTPDWGKARKYNLITEAAAYQAVLKCLDMSYRQFLAWQRPDLTIWLLQFRGFTPEGQQQPTQTLPLDLVLLISSYLSYPMHPTEWKDFHAKLINLQYQEGGYQRDRLFYFSSALKRPFLKEIKQLGKEQEQRQENQSQEKTLSPK